MTTIIVIVVVALVFFVTICVVTFMVWKRESEMRTDSIKAIEQNLEVMLNELSDGSQPRHRSGVRTDDGSTEQIVQQMMDDRIKEKTRKTSRKKSLDPFGWVRTQETSDKNHKIENEGDLLGGSAFEENTGDRSPEISNSRVMDRRDAEEIIFRAFERLKEETERKYIEAEEAYETFLSTKAAALEELPQEEEHPEGEPMEEQESLPDLPEQEIFQELREKEEETPQEEDIYQEDVNWEEEKEEKEEQITQETDDKSHQQIETIDQLLENLPERESEYEISFDFLNEIGEYDFDQDLRQPMGYDVGRSGRKYTASELEALIKE